MKWNKPEININKFDEENILTSGVLTFDEAERIIDIKGAEESFLDSWNK